MGASGECLAVPGQVELDPGATPQAQQLGVGSSTATQQQETEDDDIGKPIGR